MSDANADAGVKKKLLVRNYLILVIAIDTVIKG